MFTVAVIEDVVQITPENFDLPSIQALEDSINAKYCNKVIHQVGLVICLYDIQKASDGLIGNGTGIVNVNVEFRLACFRPFKGEVIQGQIKKNIKDFGIQLTLDFFDDIWVPCPRNIPKPSSFIESEQVWAWQVEGSEPGYYDNNEQVRFRVEEEIWNDSTPNEPVLYSAASQPAESKAPYTIIASMDQDGLGPNLWWDGRHGVEEAQKGEPMDKEDGSGKEEGQLEQQA